MSSKQLQTAVDMIKDVIYGDDSIDLRPDYQDMSTEVLMRAQKVLLENPKLTDREKVYYLNNIWKINYRGAERPPTIEEFLTPKYLGATDEAIFPYIRQKLIEFYDPRNQYRDAILYSFIGAGKSTFSILSTLFVTAHLILMKNPKKFFNLAPPSILTQAYFSFTMNKADELLLQPTKNLLEASSMFERCKTIDSMKTKQRDAGVTKFFWTTADSTADILFSNGASIKIGASPGKLLGNQIITGVLSEIAFCTDFGISEEKALRMLNDLKGRMNSRFKGNYFQRSIIDSSPNTMESKIDQYINNVAPFERRPQLIFKGAEWDWKTWDYEHINERFPVFLGNQTGPPRVISEEESKTFDDKEVLWVPKEIGLYTEFQNDTIKALKDKAGIPAGNADKLVQSHSNIEAIFDNDQLLNIYSCIFAHAALSPENLIWDIVKDTFFIKIGSSYEFYRYPTAPRYISVDQSISGDTTGIACIHREINLEGEIIYVVDFTVAIVPNKDKINLEAIKFFIHDLRRKGRLNIKGVSFDQFQSESTIQYLERENFEVEKVSVDAKVGPYLNLVNLVNTHRIKCGKNLFFKNNLKSLIMTKRKNSESKKVDHILGDASMNFSDLDWEKSQLGYKAKDISDPIAASIYLCDSKEKFTPQYVYKQEIEELTSYNIKGANFEKEEIS